MDPSDPLVTKERLEKKTNNKISFFCSTNDLTEMITFKYKNKKWKKCKKTIEAHT